MATKVDGLIRTYRGRPGCGCGCRGTYSDKPAGVTRRTREFIEAVRAGEEAEAADLGDGEWCLSLESDERYLWLYFASEQAAERFLRANDLRAKVEEDC